MLALASYFIAPFNAASPISRTGEKIYISSQMYRKGREKGREKRGVNFRKIEEILYLFAIRGKTLTRQDRQAVSNPVNACEGVARSGSIVRQLKGIFSSPLCHPTCRFCLFVFPHPDCEPRHRAFRGPLPTSGGVSIRFPSIRRDSRIVKGRNGLAISYWTSDIGLCIR